MTCGSSIIAREFTSSFTSGTRQSWPRQAKFPLVPRGVVTSVLRLCLYAAGVVVAAFGVAVILSIFTAGSASAASGSGSGTAAAAQSGPSGGLSSVVPQVVSAGTQAVTGGSAAGGGAAGSSAVGQAVSAVQPVTSTLAGS